MKPSLSGVTRGGETLKPLQPFLSLLPPPPRCHHGARPGKAWLLPAVAENSPPSCASGDVVLAKHRDGAAISRWRRTRYLLRGEGSSPSFQNWRLVSRVVALELVVAALLL